MSEKISLINRNLMLLIAIVATVILAYVAVMAISAWFAKGLGKSPIKWAGISALALSVFITWDYYPTKWAHHYYCETEAGFWVYKSLDQWKGENPGVFETLSVAHLPEDRRVVVDSNDKSGKGSNRKYQLVDGTILLAYFDVKDELMYVEYKKPDGESGTQVNERFRHILKIDYPWLVKVRRVEHVIKDALTDSVLSREIDFVQTTRGKFSIGGEDSWKFWLQSNESCAKEKFRIGRVGDYINDLRTDCAATKSNSVHASNGTVVRCS